MGQIMANTVSSEQGEHRFERYRECGWWPGENLEDRYERFVRANPDDLAVADSAGRQLTHAELWLRAGELVSELASQGVSQGDVVLLFLPNRVEWQLALLAVLRLRAIPASIPTKTDSATLAYVIDLVGCRAVLTWGAEHYGHLVEMASEATDAAEQSPGILSVSSDEAHFWSRKPGQVESRSHPAADLDHIMFTSSTTGLPKAVMHTADTLAALNIQFSERFSLGSDRPIFMGSPLGHSVGGIHGARLALHTGAALILQESWEPVAALRLINRYGCAFTAAATPFLKDIIDVSAAGKAGGQTSLRTFLCGGAPVPPALLEQASKAFPDTFVTNLWGMTEGGLVTCVPGGPNDKLIATAGVGLPDLELRVVDDEGRSLGHGQEGELVMRGPGVFIGYYGQEDLYRSLMTPDGFFRTGDLACIDKEGYLLITGRLKDLIIRGGVNLSPLPTEDVLASHPAIRSVAVIGYPDERLGERVCAVVVAKNGLPTLDELIGYVSEKNLPKRQWPELIRYIDAMPCTAAGKIRKPVLRELVERAGPEQLVLEVADAGR